MIEGIYDIISSLRLEYNIAIGDIISLLAFLLAIYQFNKQMDMSREEKVTTQRADWFLQVIVLPHLEGLERFYSSLIEDMERRCNTIMEEQERQQDNVRILATEIRGIKKKINNYFNELEPLVRAYDNKLGQKIGDLTLKLQDICVVIFTMCHDDDVRLDIPRQILSHKQQVLSVLGKSMTVNQ